MPTYFSFTPTTSAPDAVVPVSGFADWIQIIVPGGLIVDDLNGQEVVRNPNVDIIDSSRIIIERPASSGTTLRIQMGYNAGDIPDPDYPPLTIRVFGTSGVGSTPDWTALRNLNGDASVPVIFNPNTDSLTSNISPPIALTIPDNNAHSWDCDGYTRFVVGVEAIHRSLGGPGNTADAFLLAKMV